MEMSFGFFVLSLISLLFAIWSEDCSDWRTVGAPLLCLFFAVMSFVAFGIAKKNGWN